MSACAGARPSQGSKGASPPWAKLSPPALSLPPRPKEAPTGSEFVEICEQLRPGPREAAITRELVSGNVPGFLRRLAFVPISRAGATLNPSAPPTGVWVTRDYLAIGTDEDFTRFPMTKRSALSVARLAGCTLPTQRIVDAIYGAAECKLTSPTLGAGPRMASTEIYDEHNREIEERRGAAGCALGLLLAGPKKDLVMSARERWTPGRLAIYGWFTESGTVIQPLSLRHSDDYVDFSHGVRLVHTEMLVDGERKALLDVLRDDALAPLVSDEGGFVPIES
jgi:hypothetical protein